MGRPAATLGGARLGGTVLVGRLLRPTLPFVPHEDPRVLDSTGALELDRIPERLLVLGGGIIGPEMATVYSELGSRVSVVELMAQLIPGADKDIESAVFDKVLVAVGRRPNGRMIGAENAGVTVDDRGFIPVDKQQRTNVPPPRRSKAPSPTSYMPKKK